MRAAPTDARRKTDLKAKRVMGSCVRPRTFQKVWHFVLALVALTALMSLPTSARFIDQECIGAMGNRNIYEKVARVCDDCSNIFRLPIVSESCRKDCFYNQDFLWCLKASQRHEEIEQFNRWISILKAGRK